MPPESPLSENNSAEEYSPLTDENVAILYQIIKSAEQYPNVETQPFRAIFAAYEKILPDNGLDPDHDQIYLRFLFRLGDGREEAQSLYERFEALLEELGFQIEFVPDEGRVQEITRNIAVEIEDGDRNNAQLQSPVRPQRRSRRASFASIYDAEDESTRQIRSRASMSRLETTEQVVLDNRPSTRATTRKTEKTTINTSSRPAAIQARRNMLIAGEFARNIQQYQRRNKSVSSHGDRRLDHEPAPTIVDSGNHADKASSTGNASRIANEDGNNANEASVVSTRLEPLCPVPQSAHPYRPSRTQLRRDADTFHHYRIRAIARDVVDKWCFAALQAKDQHEHMERLASAHDREILLRQAFEHWRLRMHAKKQAIATERFFDHMERRTTRARNLMLLSKAFTHWAQCTYEETSRTSSARVHILSMKYFRVWRDITVANQLKMRHQRLRKFFGVWKRRYVRTLTDAIKADLVVHESLSRNAYWHWFWSFCERRSPEWRATRLKRRYLIHLVAAFNENRRRDLQVTELSGNLARGKVLSIWLQKMRVILSGQREATSIINQKRAAHTLQAWRLGHRYAPLARQVSNMVDWRVAGATFAAFVIRFRFEEQAEYVCRLRIMRNAFTQWNDRLRRQTLTHRIDDRYCLEVLYKWVVAERQVLLCRLLEERLKQRCLDKLKHDCLLRQSQRAHSFEVVEHARQRSCLRNFLVHWKTQLVLLHQAEQIAFEFHAPKSAQDSLQAWTRNLAHLRKLDEWARDATFYFVCRKIVKRWQATTIESRKQKRRNAYVQVRRKSKMSLATGALERWRLVTAQTNNMQHEASLTYQHYLLGVGTKLFNHWERQFDLRLDQDYQAAKHYERRLLERYLYAWIGRMDGQSSLEEIADLNYEMRIKNVAFSWFHKLRFKLIEMKGREANAESLRNWYEKRHYHNILRQWQDKTAKKLNRSVQGIAFSPRMNRISMLRLRAEGGDNATSRAEDWTEFEIGDWIPALEAQSSTTPVPGYLSTPSKRVARAKALVRVSTTPAGTPFESRLRSPLSSNPRTSRRGGFVKSTAALRESTFGAILEDSPKTPGTGRE